MMSPLGITRVEKRPRPLEPVSLSSKWGGKLVVMVTTLAAAVEVVAMETMATTTTLENTTSDGTPRGAAKQGGSFRFQYDWKRWTTQRSWW